MAIAKPPDERPILELRRYRIAQGRRNDFDRRIREVAMPLFAELGFAVTPSYWQAVDDPEVLVYGVWWASEHEMTTKWAAFGAHPRWIDALAEFDSPDPVAESIESQLLVSAAPLTSEKSTVQQKEGK